MPLHVTGDRCPNCKSRGLVVGGFSILTEEQPVFRPKGWLLDRLEVEREVCPSCGFIVFALSPKALRRLKKALRKDRENETVTYHARTKPRKKVPSPKKERPEN